MKAIEALDVKIATISGIDEKLFTYGRFNYQNPLVDFIEVVPVDQFFTEHRDFTEEQRNNGEKSLAQIIYGDDFLNGRWIYDALRHNALMQFGFKQRSTW